MIPIPLIFGSCKFALMTRLARMVVSVSRTISYGLQPISSLCQRAYRTRVTFGLVLPCRKTRLATYMQTRNAISLRVEDIGRRRLLTQPRPGRQLPVVSAFPRERRIASPLSGTTLYPCHKITNTSYTWPTAASNPFASPGSIKETRTQSPANQQTEERDYLCPKILSAIPSPIRKSPLLTWSFLEP